MSGWARTTAVLAVAGVATVGCAALPEGVDGDLVAAWGPMPEAEQIVPEAGVCHSASYEQGAQMGQRSYQPIDCDHTHRVETVHVGEFTEKPGDWASPPGERTATWREAYQECDHEATAYLGGDFRIGWLSLEVVVPARTAWHGGARWFRCDVAQVNNHDRIVPRQGSLRGVLTRESALHRRCFRVVASEPDADGHSTIEVMRPVDCATPHQAQFVGVLFPSRHPDEDDDAREEVVDGCYAQIKSYLGLPAAARPDIWIVHTSPSQWDWANGNRGVQCHLYVPGGELTSLLEGAGFFG